MSGVTCWRTDEPCPACGTGLILVEDGDTGRAAECRLCGWSGPWACEPGGDDR